MAEGLLIQVGADVNNAIRGLDKLTSKLGDVDDAIPSLIKNSANLEDALDKLGKQGLLSINSLGQSINDFKTLFNNATNPEQAKKYGDALKVLQTRQQSLIDSGLGVVQAEEKIGHAHAANTVGVQRLSSSFLGLSKIFEVLPPELSHLTHSFDQIFAQFERTAHGTESTGEAIKKFTGVLGEVGLGLAIGLVVGLLADFVKGLLDSDEALDRATEQGFRFAEAIKKIDDSIKDSKENIKFISQLSDINIDINFGKGKEGDLLKVRGGLEDLRQDAFALANGLKEAGTVADEAFKSMQESISDAGRAVVAGFPTISDIPEAAVKKLGDLDKELIGNAKKTADARVKIQEEINANEKEQSLQAARIRLTKVEGEKKTNKDLEGLLQSRANIIKEFTAKFASIKDPFPDFFAKNLPLGKVEDKALRAALENAFKVFEQAQKDIFNVNKIDPTTLPIEIKFKPEIVGKSDLVRQIEDKFGEIKKEIEDGINKGIIDVPLDFRLPAEGNGQALKVAEDLVDNFVKSIEGLTGQKRAILDIDTDILAKLDPAKVRDTIEKLQDELAVAVGGVPFKVVGKVDVKLVVDKNKVAQQLAKDINEGINSFANDFFTGIGETIGDALSKGIDSGSLKDVLGSITNLLAVVGKALIKAGVQMLGLDRAIKALKLNPAVSIAFGVALIALSRALANSVTNARERGGPVQKGFAYTVNEKGREAFLSNSGKLSMIEGGIQTFNPWESGKILPASIAKAFAQKFNMPRFESGGLITGPTFGLLGEGAGISRFNPEVIAPLNTLKGLLGFGGDSNINLNLVMETRGKDLKLIGNRTDRSQRRTT